MKLQMFKRTAEKKSESTRIRREGQIPAIIYVQGKAAIPLAISSGELTSLMRNVKPGRLATTVFTLSEEGGKERRVLIKEIQYHPTTYAVTHLDFEELHDKTKVNVNVPIECIGMAECPGIKLGGVLRQVIRYIRVRCLPKDIPAALELNISALGPRGALRLQDLPLPKDVRPIANLSEVAAVIVKR